MRKSYVYEEDTVIIDDTFVEVTFKNAGNFAGKPVEPGVPVKVTKDQEKVLKLVNFIEDI